MALVFHRKAQSVLRRNGPWLMEGEKDIARVVRRRFESQRVLIPFRARIGKVEAATAGQAKLNRGERLVSRVSKLVHAFDANNGLRRRDELHGDPLIDNGVAGAQRGSTTRRAISQGGREQ